MTLRVVNYHIKIVKYRKGENIMPTSNHQKQHPSSSLEET